MSILKPAHCALLIAAFLLAACRTAHPVTQPVIARTVAEAPATPPPFRLPGGARPVQYRIALTVAPGSEGFHGEEEIEVSLSAPTRTLWLNAKNLTVSSAVLTSPRGVLHAEVLPGGAEFVGFRFPSEVSAGAATLRLEFQGKVSRTEFSGLFSQKESGREFLFTQFEETDARQGFPCFDEPGFKVPFQLTLTVPRGMVAASNTPIESSVNAPSNMTRITFARTPPIPSYLVAFVVGPFEVVELGALGARSVPVRLLIPPGRRADVAFDLTAIPPLLAVEEAYFGSPFPYRKLDIVDVPNFFGAMENPGLITFLQSELLVRPGDDTPVRQQTFSLIFAHELAHQWFGDSVTLAWWDETWLNESFASWMEKKAVEQWKPEWQGAFESQNGRNIALRADAQRSQRAIQRDIKSADDIKLAFEGTTAYLKGETILAMFEAWLGPEAFRRGIQRYLREHADGSAHSDDLFQTLSRESGREVAPVFSSFLVQPGAPRVSFERVCAAEGPAKLRMRQQRYVLQTEARETSERWQIPVCVSAGGHGKTVRKCVLLTAERDELTLPPEVGCPDWVNPNAGGLGYYRSSLEPALRQAALTHAKDAWTAPERVSLLSDLVALVGSGDLTEKDRLQLLPVFAGDNEPNVQSMLVQTSTIPDELIAKSLWPRRARYLQKYLGPRTRKLGLTPRPDETKATRELRVALVGLMANEGEDLVLRAQVVKAVKAWLATHEGLTPELVGTALAVAVRAEPISFTEQLVKAAQAEPDRARKSRLLGALAAVNTPEKLARVFPLLLDPATDPNAFMGLLFGLAFREPTLRPEVFSRFENGYDALVARLPQDYLAMIPVLTSALCEPAALASTRAFFEKRVGRAPGDRERLKQSVEAAERCIARKEVRTREIASFLQGSREGRLN